MYTIEHPRFRCSTGISVIDPRTWRVCIDIDEQTTMLARHVVDDFGNLVRVSEWLS